MNVKQETRVISLVLLICAFLSVVVYTTYTKQVWEDYYIASRYSVNLCEGNGLTHYPGNRIYGYTSPLAVFLLAISFALTEFSSVDGMFWIYRIFTIGAFLLGLLYLIRALSLSEYSGWKPALLFPAILYSMESKIVAFSTNGMETGFVLFFLAGSIWILARSVTSHPVAMGVFWAGLMWSRPDSCIYIAAMGVGVMLFAHESRYKLFTALLKAAGICSALYLPWILWAWFYYGSPIPQTVLAKGLSPFSLSVVLQRLSELPKQWFWLYLPPWSQYDRGWDNYKFLAVLPSIVGNFYWLWPGGRVLGRITSFMAFAGLLYLALLPRCFPWYYPAIVLLTLPPLAACVGHLGNMRKCCSLKIIYTFIVLAAVIIFTQAALLYDYAQLARVTSQINDKGNRKLIGLWLKDNAASEERVFLECVGYIGFYSGLRMVDYPGLVSPEVVRARKHFGDNMARVGMILQPEWMVLRPGEINKFKKIDPKWLSKNFELKKIFDVSKKLKKAIPEHPASLFDSVFYVFRRR